MDLAQQPASANGAQSVSQPTVEAQAANDQSQIGEVSASQSSIYVSPNKGAMAQLTEAEKSAIEAKMVEILLKRETDSAIRAKYKARLERLRQLARTQEVRASELVSE